jgi:hypothetical protein
VTGLLGPLYAGAAHAVSLAMRTHGHDTPDGMRIVGCTCDDYPRFASARVHGTTIRQRLAAWLRTWMGRITCHVDPE